MENLKTLTVYIDGELITTSTDYDLTFFEELHDLTPFESGLGEGKYLVKLKGTLELNEIDTDIDVSKSRWVKREWGF